MGTDSSCGIMLVGMKRVLWETHAEIITGEGSCAIFLHLGVFWQWHNFVSSWFRSGMGIDLYGYPDLSHALDGVAADIGVVGICGRPLMCGVVPGSGRLVPSAGSVKHKWKVRKLECRENAQAMNLCTVFLEKIFLAVRNMRIKMAELSHIEFLKAQVFHATPVYRV
jgi:hypothetical protein